MCQLNTRIISGSSPPLVFFLPFLPTLFFFSPLISRQVGFLANVLPIFFFSPLVSRQVGFFAIFSQFSSFTSRRSSSRFFCQLFLYYLVKHIYIYIFGWACVSFHGSRVLSAPPHYKRDVFYRGEGPLNLGF